MPVLKGVSFPLSPGEVLGIVGPSAAGKSTLARMLVGVSKPNDGGVYLDGHNVYLWERGILRRHGRLSAAERSRCSTERSRDNIARMRDAGSARRARSRTPRRRS